MKWLLVMIRLLWVATVALGLTGMGCQRQPAPVRVELDTALGPIELAVDVARAPRTAENFLSYVDAGFYTEARFHRTVTAGNQSDSPVRIEVIQASVNEAREKEEQPPIVLERTTTTGLAHKDGTLSMARAEADTATTSFFICIGDQPSLDFGGARNPDGQGFAAFGRVVRGMEVVRAIHSSPTSGQTLTPPIAIRSARRLP